MSEEKVNSFKGIGLDIGTGWILSARQTKDDIQIRRMRDAFLDLPTESEKMLKLSGVNFVKREDSIWVLGDQALEIANIFGKEARRPLSAGLISPSEIDSLEVLGLLVKNVLGEPVIDREYCYFSVPAMPLDQSDKDVIYHESVFKKIILECGYTPVSANEAMAIIYSETAPEGFSGLSFSWGAGLVNVALAVNTIEGLSFSVARSGDHIDRGAAQSLASTQARMCTIKEKGIDLNDPQGREEEAITFYYKAAIEYVLDQVVTRFKLIRDQFALPRPIPMIISGGTSLAGGFMPLFQEIFDAKRKHFPIEISEIRPAKEPLESVARGLLIQARQEY